MLPGNKNIFLRKDKPIVHNKPEDKFKSYLQLPGSDNRIAEGGLRTKGLFKYSYKQIDNEWWIINDEGNKLEKVSGDISNQLNTHLVKIKTNHLPLITVITVVFNGEKYLERTIKSVLGQTYPNIEYIIIDGGSTDGTLDIIKKYENSIDYWVSEPDKGISDAFNKGVKLALGEIIGIINADDWYENHAISLAVEQFYINNIGFVLGYLRKHTVQGSYISYPQNLYSKWFNYIALIFNHPSCFVKSKVYKQYGLFKSFKYAMDYDLLIRFIKNDVNYSVINEVIVNMQDGGISEQQIVNTIRDVYLISITNGANVFFAKIILMLKLFKTEIRIKLNLEKIGVKYRNKILLNKYHEQLK